MNTIKRIFGVSAMAILLILAGSCSDNSTSTDPDTNDPNPDETEEATGAIEVTTTTGGSGTDEDGYTVSVDGGNAKSINSNGSVSFEDLDEGDYDVELEGLDSGCTVEGENPVSAKVTADNTTSVDFKVTCEEQTQSSAQGKIVYMKRVDQSTTELFIMKADGSGSQQIGDGIEGNYPSISPDGSQLAYVSSGAIWIVNIDGSNAQQLTFPDEFYGDSFPAWSPDGSKIVYQSAVEKNYNNYEIYTMDADGTNQEKLTDNPADDERPSWSPDESSIIFTSDRDDDGSSEIYSIDVESGDETVVMEPTDDNGINLYDVAWSPDGSKIAYQGYTQLGASRIFIADANGENAEFVTSTDVSARQPTWSPDGDYIAFMSLSDGEKTDAIWTIKVDDGQEIKLTDDQGTYSRFPSWGPTVK